MMTLKDKELKLRLSNNPEIQEFFQQLDSAADLKQIWKLMNNIPTSTDETKNEYFIMSDLCSAKERAIRKAQREERAKLLVAKKEEKQQQSNLKKDRISNSPIAKAVEPLKAEAMDRAETFAHETIKKVEEILQNSNFDLRIAAPYPKTFTNERTQAISKYNLFHTLCKSREGSHMIDSPVYADINPEAVEKYIKNVREDAAIQYDEFIAKLVEKIGDVTEANLTGNHVWGHSILTVKMPDGFTEKWKTQMIINVSKLGKVFNQWPTRKIK